MQEKKEPGQGDMGKEWPKKEGEIGKEDIGKKGGTGDIGREGDKTGSQPGTEKR
jgi:hypothetical protein